MNIGTDNAAAGGMFRARRLGHANLYVSDLARSMAFYHEVVGLEETYRRPDVKAGFFSNGNTHHDIGMVEVKGPTARQKDPGLNHFGFELDNEVDLVDGYRRALHRGVSFYRTVDHVICRSVYTFDPDGNANEIYADVTKDWRTERTGVVTGFTPHWTPGEPKPSPEPKYHPKPEIRRVEHAAFHPLRITHAVVVAANFEGLFRHYTGIVGLVPTLGGADSPFAVLAGVCGHSISLFRERPGRPRGLHHVGFPVESESDLDEARSKLGRLGLAIEREIDDEMRRSIFILDPDGIRLEFYVDRSRDPARLNEIDEDIALFLA